MKDMMMSDTGDLILVEDTSKENKIKLKFNISKTNPICLSFSFRENIPEIKNSNICLSFAFNSPNKKYKEKTLDGNKVLNQLLTIALKTPVNSLSHDTSFGNELEYYKHCHIGDEKNIALIEQCIKKSFQSILSNFDVYAIKNKSKKINDSSQTLSIKIETSEKTFLKDVEV